MPPHRHSALASAGMKVYAGSHRGIPCTIGQSRLNSAYRQLLGVSQLVFCLSHSLSVVVTKHLQNSCVPAGRDAVLRNRASL
jgi:hypothetical protein